MVAVAALVLGGSVKGIAINKPPIERLKSRGIQRVSPIRHLHRIVDPVVVGVSLAGIGSQRLLLPIGQSIPVLIPCWIQHHVHRPGHRCRGVSVGIGGAVGDGVSTDHVFVDRIHSINRSGHILVIRDLRSGICKSRSGGRARHRPLVDGYRIASQQGDHGRGDILGDLQVVGAGIGKTEGVGGIKHHRVVDVANGWGCRTCQGRIDGHTRNDSGGRIETEPIREVEPLVGNGASRLQRAAERNTPLGFF